MKKILAALLSTIVVLTAAGCNSGESVSSGSSAADSDVFAEQTTSAPQSSDGSSSSVTPPVSSESSPSASASTSSASTASSNSESGGSIVPSSTNPEQTSAVSSSETTSTAPPPPEVHEHKYETQTFAPSCENGGYTLYSCSCGISYTDDYVPALGHDLEQTVVAPTCTAGGYTRYTCLRCDLQYSADETAARGHSWGNWTTRMEPTSSSEGEEVSVCSACGEEQRRSIPRLNDFSSYASSVVELVNAERAKAGLSPLAENGSLNDFAQLRSSELVNDFAHKRPDGSRPLDYVMGMDGVHRAGENIAMGQTSPEDVMNAWMNSEGHRENILKSDFTMIGVGCYEYDGKLYWTQIFAGK